MSLDRSLKTSGNLASARSVLTRAERIARIKEMAKKTDRKTGALHLPKTRVRAGM